MIFGRYFSLFGGIFRYCGDYNGPKVVHVSTFLSIMIDVAIRNDYKRSAFYGASLSISHGTRVGKDYPSGIFRACPL